MVYFLIYIMKDKTIAGLIAILVIILAVAAKIRFGKEDWIIGLILVLAVAVGWFARGAKKK
jgi:1,4-dihydroxy-2-naphthoate octaprenyltransferase